MAGAAPLKSLLMAAGIAAVMALPAAAQADTLVGGGVNGKIVFASDRGTSPAARSLSLGSSQQRSTGCRPSNGGNGPAGDQECAFDIFTMNPDGSGVVNLTAGQAGENHALDDEPSWSPDGTKIAFVSRRDCGDDSSPNSSPCTTDLWVMNADGSGLRQLTDACATLGASGCRQADLHDNHPSWSPDGSKIVFSRGGYRNGDGRNADLFVIASNGTPGSETQLETDSFTFGPTGPNSVGFSSSWSPYWSPDGSTIYFTQFRFFFVGGLALPGLSKSDAQSKLAGLSLLSASDVSALYDGFSAQQIGGLDEIDYSLHTYKVPASGGSTSPTPVPGAVPGCVIGFTNPSTSCTLDANPALTADGSRIAVQRSSSANAQQGRDVDIVSFNLAGADEQALDAGDPASCGLLNSNPPCLQDFKPAYSPQGDRILFHSDRVDPSAGPDAVGSPCDTEYQQFKYPNCERAIYTMAPNGTAISGPLGRGQLTAAPADGPSVDRNADWQRTLPARVPGCSDSTGPTLTITSNQHRNSYRKNERGSVRVAASDPSGLSVDPSTGKRSLSTKKTGSHSISVTAVDKCGNVTRTTYRYVVAVDPVVAVKGVQGSGSSCTITTIRARVSLGSAARMRRVTVSVDGKRIKTTRSKRFTVRIMTARLKAGRHTLTIVAVDRAGNRKSRSVRFSRCAPVVTPHFTG